MPPLLVLAVIALLVVVVVWLLAFGDREDAMEDEAPRLDTRGPDDR